LPASSRSRPEAVADGPRRARHLARGSMTAALISVAAAVLLAACGAAAGDGGSSASEPAGTEVTGKFVREGGPIGPGGTQPAERPLRGLVRFTASDGHVVKVRVGRSGKFVVFLWPGTYAVIGQSPQILQASSTTSTGIELPCSRPLSVTVRPHHVLAITVTCVVP